MVLAPNVTFDVANYLYWCKGKQLSGVTGVIGKKLGVKISEDFMEERLDDT